MKLASLVLLSTILGPAAAETVKCPASLDGKPLSIASAYFDKLTEIHGDHKSFKWGYVVGLRLNVKWLVCEYGEAQKWIAVKDGEKSKSCTLTARRRNQGLASAELVCN